MKTNTRATAASVEGPRTHEGALAKRITPEQELRRSVMAHMLFEGEFYEDGVSAAERIRDLVTEVDRHTVAKIAVEARERMKLRHVPLWLCCCLLKKGSPALVGGTIARIIQRPDEITEMVSLYWQMYGKEETAGFNADGTVAKGKRRPLPHQLKLGLAWAFEKFEGWQLAKYDRDETIKLRDVFFLVHGKTKDIVRAEHAPTWENVPGDAYGDVVFAPAVKKPSYKRGKVRRHGGSIAEQLVARTLPTPDTWETRLSAAKTPKERLAVWTGLLERKHLGAMALLRNLSNMAKDGVPEAVVRGALLTMKVERVLPFRFLTAARHAPRLEPDLEVAMLRCLADQEKLAGETVLVVDVSGSMDHPVSAKSEVKRMDAACGIAVLVREICEQVSVVAFSDRAKAIAPRRGLALRDAIVGSMEHGNTNMADAIRFASGCCTAKRVIVITDEQSAQVVGRPWNGARGYVINVGSYRNGVGYGPWMHVDGFSEAVVDYIREFERGEV